MELRAVRYALAVAENLHFGRASEHMLVSQPSLSRQVQALEREIGVPLFERTSRRVELTPAGAQFVPLAQRALAQLDLAAERARASARGQLGQLRLGFITTAAIDVLPRLLAMHRAHRPGVSIRLIECPTADQLDALLAGDLDVAIGRDLPLIEQLHIDMVRTEPIQVAVADAHPLANREHVGLTDLDNEPIVRLPPGTARRTDMLLAQLPGADVGRSPELAGAQEANQYTTLLALVAAGMGVALVPEPVSRLYQDGVRYVLLEHPDATSAVTLASRADDRSPLVRDFRDLILTSG